MRLSHFCKRILQTQLLSLLRIAFFVNKAFAATLLQLRSVFHSCNFPWRKPKDVVPPPVGFLLMKIASRSRWNVSLFVPDRALFLSELEELKSTRRLRLISKNMQERSLWFVCALRYTARSLHFRSHCRLRGVSQFHWAGKRKFDENPAPSPNSHFGLEDHPQRQLNLLVRYYLDFFLPLETKRKHRYSTLSSLKATTAADAKTDTQSTCSEDTHQNLRKIPAPS